MTLETIQANAEQRKGLSVEDAHRAAKLYQRVARRSALLANHRDEAIRYINGAETPTGYKKPSSIVVFADDVATYFMKESLSSATRLAKNHFVAHEAAYKDQAVLDATEAGYAPHGWDDTQDIAHPEGANEAGELTDDYRTEEN